MTEPVTIPQIIDLSLEQIADIVDTSGKKMKENKYGRSENIEYAKSLTKVVEQLSSLKQQDEGVSLNDTLSTVQWLPKNMAHPFSMLKNLQLLDNQLQMLSDIDWNDTRFLYLYGSRRGSKSFAAVLAFLYAMKHRWDLKLKSGQISPSWVDFKNRGEHEGFLECAIIAPRESLLTKTLQYLNMIMTLSKLNRLRDYEVSNKKEGIYLKGGIRIYHVTASNESGLMGKGLDLILCTEFARLEENIYKQIIRPCLLDRQGIFIADTTIKKGDSWYIDLIKSGIDEKDIAWEKNHTHFKKELCRRPSVKTFFFHVKDNTFISNVDQELKRLKGDETTPGELPRYIYEQEIEGIWELTEERIFEEFNPLHHVEDHTEDKVRTVLENAKFVNLSLDIGYSNGREHEGKTALLAVAYSEYPTSYESTDYCILESFESNEIPFMDKFWTELIREWSEKYMAKTMIFDNASARNIESFKRNFPTPKTLTWKPAIKDIVESIEYIKCLFHANKIYILRQKNEQLIEDLENYKWQKKRTGESILKPAAAYSDLVDAMRYALWTPFAQKMGRVKNRHA